MTATRQEKIEAIYEKIADKTLSFGCRIKDPMYDNYKAFYCTTYTREDNWETIVKVCLTDRPVPEYKTKELSFWVIKENFDEKREIIWHPVMIWDVLERAEANIMELEQYKKFPNTYQKREAFLDIRYKRKLKRKPIEEQSDDAVDFIYNLIEQWTTKK